MPIVDCGVMDMAIIAISTGGSVLVPGKPDTAYISVLAKLLVSLSKRHRFYIVVGGGEPAREYIGACRALGADEAFLDEVGIEVTRLNARLLIAALGKAAYHRPALDFHEALSAGARWPVTVMGGTHPGHTTDAVTAMLAERARADRLVMTTNVRGVFSADPKRDPSAKFLPRITYGELVRIASTMGRAAGSKGVVDPLGAAIIERARIPTAVIDGRNLKALRAAVEGRPFDGTLVTA